MRNLVILLLAFLLLFSTDSLCQKKAKTTPQVPSSPLSDSTFFKSLTYRNVGPTRGGRVTSVTGITSQPSTYYMGSTGGGVWKTEDYGVTWKNVSDGFFQTPSIGAMQVVQHNPKIVYVGTGSDGIRSNVILGKGVYKSLDAGKTWKNIGLAKVGQIGAVEIHPRHADTVFVAAIGQPFQPNKERGVYRTRNGGKTWEQVL
ncbi:MAG: glycosyl hydrolase, partial [Cyclobacteriaceae bacterium]|nr:glycosyl hydrolase [Cyclobacteriaceae bacterium]